MLQVKRYKSKKLDSALTLSSFPCTSVAFSGVGLCVDGETRVRRVVLSASSGAFKAGEVVTGAGASVSSVQKKHRISQMFSVWRYRSGQSGRGQERSSGQSRATWITDLYIYCIWLDSDRSHRTSWAVVLKKKKSGHQFSAGQFVVTVPSSPFSWEGAGEPVVFSCPLEIEEITRTETEGENDKWRNWKQTSWMEVWTGKISERTGRCTMTLRWFYTLCYKHLNELLRFWSM